MKRVKYRTSQLDCFGNRWQVRGNMTWISRNGKGFHKHVPLHDVIVSLSMNGMYYNVKIIADIAANPIED